MQLQGQFVETHLVSRLSGISVIHCPMSWTLMLHIFCQVFSHFSWVSQSVVCCILTGDEFLDHSGPNCFWLGSYEVKCRQGFKWKWLLMDYVFGGKINFKGINGFSLLVYAKIWERVKHLTFSREAGYTQQEWEFKIKKLSKHYKISFR